MVTRLCITVCVLLLLAQPAVVSAQEVVPSERVRHSVLVRAEPASSSRVVDRLRVGERAQLLTSVPRWHEVRLPNGATGYVSKSWTRVVESVLPDTRSEDDLRIHYLNIGAGTCTVVECPGPNASPMIVDCGSLGGTVDDMDEDDARQYIQTILGSHPSRPNLVLSHADQDHYGWIPRVLGETPVGNIWQGGDPSDCTRERFPEWLQLQVSGGAQLHNGFAQDWHNSGLPLGQDLSCGAASVFVLTVNSGESKNAQSLVLSIEYGDFVATFTGDAEDTTEQAAILNFGGDVKATVLSGSHHGARTHGSNSVGWAHATDPEVVIFSAGTKFKHPRCEATRRYEDALSRAARHPAQCGANGGYRSYNTSLAEYMTEVNGAIIVTSSGSSPLALNCSRSESCASTINH